ncbi:MAG: 2OG-Fe(II) oxygenase [Acidimicrobiia bacterium]
MTNPNQQLDREGLLALAKREGEAYQHSAPFPHAMFDGLWSDDLLDAVAAEFPTREQVEWTTYDNANELKYVCSDPEQFGPATWQLASMLNSAVFLRFLEALTGIDHLVPDPYFHAAGLFDVPEGGFLDLHADWSGNPNLLLDRRINVLVYLNRDWTEANGGALELWRREPKECVESILPLFNRTVVFNTTGGALHGHPVPVQGVGKARRVFSAYYFTNGRIPLGEQWGTHGVLFNDEKAGLKVRARHLAHGLTPPAVYDVLRATKDRRSRGGDPTS